MTHNIQSLRYARAQIPVPSTKSTNQLLKLSMKAIDQHRAILWYPGFKGTTTMFRSAA